MRVAIDATPLAERAGGVRRYTEELARALASEFPSDEYVLVSDQPFDTALPLERGRAPSTPITKRWWLYGVQSEMRRLGSDVFHGTDFAVPYLPVRPSVMTLHDLSPWRADTADAASVRVRTRTPALLRLGLATMVITPSEAVRVAAIREFSLSPEGVVAVPEAASLRGSAPSTRSTEKPYFLFVGTIEARKNVANLIRAWREIRNEADLVIIGRTRAGGPGIEPEPGLQYLGERPDEELPGWYSGAAACVYPSFYEGFGLPVLEAMQCGTPVIASRDPAITEVAGGAALQVEATDVPALVGAMRAMLTPAAAEWRERGLRRSALFSWERTARETREVYAEAIRRFHHR